MAFAPNVKMLYLRRKLSHIYALKSILKQIIAKLFSHFYRIEKEKRFYRHFLYAHMCNNNYNYNIIIPMQR